ncbi:TARBP1 [Scenedesmus sp. PABB004]|nr:TARBP1 [Scenedesmus sp. PABB004]
MAAPPLAELPARLAALAAAAPPGAPLAARQALAVAAWGAAAAATPAALSALFDAAREALADGRGDEALAAAAAALAGLEARPVGALVLAQFADAVLLPLAAARARDGAQAEAEQLVRATARLLARGGHWGLALDAAAAAHASLAPEGAAAGARLPEPQAGRITLRLPPAVAAAAVAALSEAAAAAAGGDDAAGAAPLLALCAGPLFGTALQLLTSPNAALRRLSFQVLLPALLDAAGAAGARAACMAALWRQCLDMAAAPALPRRMGLALLLHHHAAWGVLPPSPGDGDGSSGDCASDAAAASGADAPAAGPAAAPGESRRFWAVLRSCLADGEPLNRKRALRLLQLLLPEAELRAAPVWGTFLVLLELLEEFSVHLVKESWPLVSAAPRLRVARSAAAGGQAGGPPTRAARRGAQVSTLHPAAPEFAGEDAAADVAHSGAMNRIKRAQAGQQAPGGGTMPQGGDGAGAGADAPLPLAFEWTRVLWELALRHKNLQVQRMALKTLLKRRWTARVLSSVPVAFITGSLLPALMSPVHHRVASAGGLTATGGAVAAGGDADADADADADGGDAGGRAFALVPQAAALLGAFARAAGPAAAREVIAGGLALAAAPGQELPRAGCLALLRALAGAAEGGGGAGRARCWRAWTSAPAPPAAAPAGSCRLAAAARLVQALPGALQGPGGPLHGAVRAWLLGGGHEGGVWLAEQAGVMWEQFFGAADGAAPGGQRAQQPAAAQAWGVRPHDYQAWRASADAWQRVALCAGDALQPLLAAACAELADRVEQLSSRSYLPPGAAERTLVMLGVLLEGAEAAGRVAAEAGEPPPPLTAAVARLAEAAAGPLGRAMEAYASCFWRSPAELAWGGGAGGGPPPAPDSAAPYGLPASSWAAAARAEAAAGAAAAAVLLLARHVSGCWDACGADEGTPTAPAVAPPARRGAAALLQLLGALADVGERLADQSLPVSSPPPDAGAPRAGAVPPQLHEAAAAEQSRAAALDVLAHASLGLSRALACCPELAPALRCRPVAWQAALQREVAAARAAHDAWLPAASAAASVRSGDPMQGWLCGMHWRACDGTMALLAAVQGGGAAARGAQLPRGALPPALVGELLAQALDALQWTTTESGSDAMQLLRCLRRLWTLVAADEALQAAAAERLDAAGALPSAEGAPLSRLAGGLSRGLLDMLLGAKKRPEALYSAALGALLLPGLCAFDPSAAPGLAALHAGDGAPLRGFVRGLLDIGAKGSPRLMLVLALHLSALLPAAPALLGWYAPELRRLGLPSLEACRERVLLAGPLDAELQDAYALTDIGPRVAVVSALHALATAAGLGGGGAAAGDDAWAAEAEAAGVALWGSWLEALRSDPLLGGERFKVGSDVHRLKVRAWQGLTAASAFFASPRQRPAAEAAVADLVAALGDNNPPSLKQYQEAVLASLLLAHPGLLEAHVLPALASVERGSAATASELLIAVQVALHSPPATQAALLPRVASLLLPWTNHHTHSIRTFAQLGFIALAEAAPMGAGPGAWPGWDAGLGPGGAAVLGELLRFTRDNADFQRFRRAMGAGIAAWSPAGLTAPRRIFSTSLHLAGAEEVPVTFEGVPEALLDRLTTFLTAERAKLRGAAVDRVAGYAGGPQAAPPAAQQPGGGGGGGGGAPARYQRKVTPSERAALMADVLDELPEPGAGGAAGPAGTARHELLVVASLIHKAPNLGGLARTAEVLGAGALVLGDARVTSEQGFTSVSVTAERWVPLLEVREAELLGWLSARRAEGYALVGLEQTAESRVLPHYAFPRRTVLVLGREKEGIPPEVIAMLDATVEIPQLGVVRSLNVHVAGALAMYEYARQRLPPAPGGGGGGGGGDGR